MEWKEYISYLLSTGKNLDNLSISLDEGHTVTEVPPIIRTSISMLDKMIEKQGRLNVLVFPEKDQSVFIFTLMKLFHNISSGKIRSNYDPTGFLPGEKLKVGNAIVEYRGMTEKNGEPYLSIKLADLNSSTAPLSICPIFQKVSTKRKLSKYKQYAEARKKAELALNQESSVNEKLLLAETMKTHMDSSVFAMTSVLSVKEKISKCHIEGKKITDIFYIAQTDYEGKIRNISPGQMTGIPAIVFSSDLYSINEAVEQKNPVQSIIIDISNTNVFLDQLDALDELIRLNVPIVCITDVADSFEMEPLIARGFNVWRWDKDSITDQLYDAVPIASDKKIGNCAKQNITYLKTDGGEISEAMKLLVRHRKETEEQSSQMMKLFERLNRLTFSALRAIVPLSDIGVELARRNLDECQSILNQEADYISEQAFCDYEAVINNLRKIYSHGYSLKKEEMLKKYLQEHNTENICLVIPEREPQTQIQEYWSAWCRQHFIKANVRVLTPTEYYAWPRDFSDVTVICGWLKRIVMRKVIFSFNTSRYVVLLYDYENRWRNHEAHRWTKALDNSGNKNIIEKSFSSDKIAVSTVRYDERIQPDDTLETDDELGEIELILKENKYRQYLNGGSHSSSDTVAAIPINFVGGYLAFYRTGHTVVSATKIILLGAEKIEPVLASDLKVGDFIVVRESDRDLVREIADVVLENSGKGHLRELASKWREALNIELVFCTLDDLCEKIKNAGCDKGIPTIKRWIEDESVIAPREKDDLRILAKVTENETLFELLDQIFDAAKEVRNAHVLAGRKLSEQLKRTLGKELKKFGDIDPFNFWEPIDMDVEGIGNVKILKIIDIGAEIQLDPADTNRLIAE